MYRIGQEEIDAVARVINAKTLFKINSGTKEVMNFESEWSELVGSDYTLLMTSGFAAITSALIGFGIGPGDEVIVPAYTYIATALAVTNVGAIPVIADVDETLTIDPEDVKRKISPYTKAIIPVHIMGFPSNMDALTDIAKEYGLKIVEDACQSIGGKFNGRYLGSIGDAGAYSFNYYKVITAGEGGGLVTNDRETYERALIYHDSSAIAFFGGQLDDVTQPVFGGTEFRVSDITGAILREQLKKLPGIITDLHRVRDGIVSRLSDKIKVSPSHDFKGDCATTLSLRFDSADECNSFMEKCAEKGVYMGSPINTGKHVYTNWTQIMEKRGALHPAMDPFKMEANKNLNHNYSFDMCAKTLDLLARTAYLGIDPDMTEEGIAALAEKINSVV